MPRLGSGFIELGCVAKQFLEVSENIFVLIDGNFYVTGKYIIVVSTFNKTAMYDRDQ